MKITSKTLMMSFSHDIIVGYNDAIKATVDHQIYIFRDKNGEIGFDLDHCDTTNIKFMGIPIENNYKSKKSFVEKMLELGIDVDALIDDKISKLITDEDINELKKMYTFND